MRLEEERFRVSASASLGQTRAEAGGDRAAARMVVVIRPSADGERALEEGDNPAAIAASEMDCAEALQALGHVAVDLTLRTQPDGQRS